MPIKIPNGLPGTTILEGEGIPIINEDRALLQDIRPLQVLILNLMPDKVGTETQILRALGATPLQLEITFLHAATHDSKNTPEEHLTAFYKKHSEIADRKFDAMIMTGAPIGTFEFEEVLYWKEVQEILDWAKTHVYSCFFICWGALAALYHHHGVPKYILEQKKMGVFRHKVLNSCDPLTRGFDDFFYVPIARSTKVKEEDFGQNIETLVATEEGEPCIMQDKNLRHVYVVNHLEYDAETLRNEYERDKAAGMKTALPYNYFPDDNPEALPQIVWRAHRSLLFTNWINTIYQGTPYDISKIGT